LTVLLLAAIKTKFKENEQLIENINQEEKIDNVCPNENKNNFIIQEDDDNQVIRMKDHKIEDFIKKMQSNYGS
jgi:hypothetical protein